VHESFSPALVIRPINLAVGEVLWVTGSSLCTGSPLTQTCNVAFVPLITADTSVLERKPSSATYEGLPAQQFVAVAAGRTVLAPTGPCPTPACSNVAVFPADLDITVSK
jgi:hypothetical protein